MQSESITDYTVRRVAGSNYLAYIGKSDRGYNNPVCLNSVGADICELLIEGKGRSEIAAHLSTKYNISQDTIIKDVSDFISQLISNGIIINQEEEEDV